MTDNISKMIKILKTIEESDGNFSDVDGLNISTPVQGHDEDGAYQQYSLYGTVDINYQTSTPGEVGFIENDEIAKCDVTGDIKVWTDENWATASYDATIGITNFNGEFTVENFQSVEEVARDIINRIQSDFGAEFSNKG